MGLPKYGRDEELEGQADKILGESVRSNDRSIERDIEKLRYEHGIVSEDGLEHYDPANDWDAHDSAFTIYVDPAELVDTVCAEDGNVRARNPAMEARRGLMRRTEDWDDWGPSGESIPLLGANDGPRKTCTKCGRSKGLQYFSPDARNRDGLHSWCKECRKEFTSQKRNNRS